MSNLVLKRAATSRPSGTWYDDDFDVLCNGEIVGRIHKANAAPVGSPWMWTLAFGQHTDARGCDGCICQELATGIGPWRPWEALRLL
jgi:hypothetical protein